MIPITVGDCPDCRAMSWERWGDVIRCTFCGHTERIETEDDR